MNQQPPPAYPPLPPPYPGYTAAPRPASRTALFVVVTVVVALTVVIGAISAAVAFRGSFRSGTGARSTNLEGINDATLVTTERGVVVFSDDFRDSKSGWDTSPGDGVTYTYTGGGFVIDGKGSWIYFASSPYRRAHQQMSMSMTATVPSNRPNDAGFGVGCSRGSGAATLVYEFLVIADGSWSVSRRDGRVTESSHPMSLKEGTSKSVPGPTPLNVVAICATLSDKSTNRLVLFIDRSQVADITDVATNLPGRGWYANILVAGTDAGAAPVTVRSFEERNLARRS
jgi:hypothetical protein